MNTPIRAFISYKWESDDVKQWVERFATDLRQNGVDALLDKWEVKYGESFIDYMCSKIPSSDVFLFVITPGAVASVETDGKEGGAVKFEVEMARAQTIAGEDLRFIPVLREGCDVPKHLRAYYYVDFRDNSKYAESFASLLDDLKGKQKKPPLLGVGTMRYDGRLYRMIPAVEVSPLRAIMARFEPFVGFPFYSHESDHPAFWPQRVGEDRAWHASRILSFVNDSRFAAAIARALDEDGSKIEKISSRKLLAHEERHERGIISYGQLRMLYNTTLNGDAEKLSEIIGKQACDGFLELEQIWQVIDSNMPNRLFVLALSHDRSTVLNDVNLSLAVVGDIYDIMLDEQRVMDRERLYEIHPGRKFILKLDDIPPAATAILRIWYKYTCITEIWEPSPMDLKGEPTQGIILQSLGANGVDIEWADNLIDDGDVYEPYDIRFEIPKNQRP